MVGAKRAAWLAAWAVTSTSPAKRREVDVTERRVPEDQHDEERLRVS
jgi:hypothetical protein